MFTKILSSIHMYLFYGTNAKLHPFCQQKEIVKYCAENDIVVQAYCPIIRGRFDNPVIQELAKKVWTFSFHSRYIWKAILNG